MVILDEKILEEQKYFVVQQNILIEKAKMTFLNMS